ncbi:antibiotic biosynthesis monooxygenase [Belnapia sp. F-4-1]|uniref:antibiotic biosynthesis monooxygenase family protein n=1 Tax=Belnapia sp. F-4-1 TaxID=1545443 RepID=UPI0011861AA6
MITELALLRLLPGSGSAFTAASASASPLLTSADGYIRHRLVSALESTDLYLLAVGWRDVAAHTGGFENSEAHARFMAPLKTRLSGDPIVLHVRRGRSATPKASPQPSLSC